MNKGAVLSDCRNYRYLLWRDWGDGLSSRTVMFIGLNPSTADETDDDPTIRRCIGFARAWGFHRLLMANTYGYRSTDPKGLCKADDPIGPDNDRALRLYADESELIIAAWGANCSPDRARAVMDLLSPKKIFCLGRTKKGDPRHPLYLRADTQPEEFCS